MRSPLDVVVGGPNLRRRAADVKRALAPFSAVTGVLSSKCADKAPDGTGGPSPRDTLPRNGRAALDGATRRWFAAPVKRRSDGPAGRAPRPRPAPWCEISESVKTVETTVPVGTLAAT